jgi:hypothetical protein
MAFLPINAVKIHIVWLFDSVLRLHAGVDDVTFGVDGLAAFLLNDRVATPVLIVGIREISPVMVASGFGTEHTGTNRYFRRI